MVKKVKLCDLGERKAVELIQRILSESTIDIGDMKDDCAVLDFGEEYLLITTDMISRATHLPEMASPWQIGWHAVAVNLSDIAAMGGKPLGIVVSLGLPRDYHMKSLEDMMEGMRAVALKFAIPILGGDTKELNVVTLSGCALGRVAKNDIMLRKGAKPGDIVAVTGELGKASAAFYSLKNKIEEEQALKDILEVQPRVTEGLSLSKTGAVTSCMDISDGLASSMYQLSELNEVGYQIDFDKIPISEKTRTLAEKLDIPAEELVLYFGGDYELLVTLEKEKVKEAQEALSKIGAPLTHIGEVKKLKKNTLIKDGVSTILENRGYEHFRWKP